MTSMAGCADDGPSQNKAWLACLVAAHAALLLVAVWHNRGSFGPDAIPYMRIAGYYASGDTALMISGYWGPLISWLMAPLIRLGVPALTAAWTIMFISAIGLLLSCVLLFRRLRLPPAGQSLASTLVAIVSVGWCASDAITPDLLLCTFILFAIARTISAPWLSSTRYQAGTGLVWSIAYFSKAVAFPLAFLITAGIACFWWLTRSTRLLPLMRAAAVTLTAFLICALPWLTVLSIKYHRPTFSVTLVVNHGGVGPGVDPGDIRISTFQMFHTPAPGRISSWEDPTSLPYPMWSAFQSLPNALHQLKLIEVNALFELATIRNFDLLGFGFVSLIVGTALVWVGREHAGGVEPWQWCIAPLLAVLLIYLPNYGASSRYYYLAYIFLLAASVGLANWISGRVTPSPALMRRMLYVAIAASFSIGMLPEVWAAVHKEARWQQTIARARARADQLRSEGIVGPVAGGAVDGVYLSYSLSQPFHGSVPMASMHDFDGLKGKVKLLLVERNNPAIDMLRTDANYRELEPTHSSDTVLFELLSP
jgi:hypothetical protein